MATPISSHVKDKNSIFTARDEDKILLVIKKEKSWYIISIYIIKADTKPYIESTLKKEAILQEFSQLSFKLSFLTF